MTNLFYATYFGGGLSAEHVDGGTSRFDRRGQVYQSVCAGCGEQRLPDRTEPGRFAHEQQSELQQRGVQVRLQLPIVVAGFQTPPVNCLPLPSNSRTRATARRAISGTSATTAPSCRTPATSTPVRGVYGDPDRQRPERLQPGRHRAAAGGGAGNSGYALDDVTLCAVKANRSACCRSGPERDLRLESVRAYQHHRINPTASPAVTTTYQLLISNGLCTDTVTQVVNVAASVLDAGPDLVACGPGPGSVTLAASSAGGTGLFPVGSSPAFSDT